MPDIPGRGVKCSRGDSRALFIIGVGTAILGQAHRPVQETSGGGSVAPCLEEHGS